jgi:uncharacterized protein
VPQRILITGARGFLGACLSQALSLEGAEVVPLLRGTHSSTALTWDAGITPLPPQLVSGFDAVIHLSGEPIVGLWTQAKKQRIWDSRIQSTRALTAAMLAVDRPPKVFLCASGTGFYGDQGDRLVDEDDPQGTGFLAEVCTAWEEAACSAATVARVVHLRLGAVLSTRGGGLAPLSLLYRLGLGGTLGTGQQFISWIALKDVANAVRFLLREDALHGPINLASPNAVTARAFSDWLARATHKPALLPKPAWLMRSVLGREAANEIVLSGVRAQPARLLDAGFSFACPELPPSLPGLE